MPSFPPARGTTGSLCRPPTRLPRLPGAWLASLVFLAGCPTLFARHDPESEARRELGELSRSGLELASTAQPVRLARIDLSEIEVDGQDPPSVLFHVIATGTCGAAALGYYGSEHVSLRRVDGRLVAPTSWFPKLAGVLQALAAKEAVPSGESDSLSIRIDGDRAQVSTLSGAGRRTYSLARLGDSWHFSSGLL